MATPIRLLLTAFFLLSIAACSSSSDSTISDTTLTDFTDAGDSGDPTDNNDGETDSGFNGILATTGELVNDHSAPPDVVGGNYIRAKSNSAILTGPAIGSGALSNTSLVMNIPFIRPFPLDDALEVLKVTMVQTATPTQLAGMITVRNNSGEQVCDVSPSFNYILKDERILGRGDFTWGFLGDMADFVDIDDGDYSIFGDECLAPGSIGYHAGFVRIDEEINFDTISHFEFYRFNYFSGADNAREPVAARSKLIPKSYTLGTDDDGDAVVELTIANEGVTTLSFSGCRIIVLDEDGYPLSYEGSARSRILAVGDVEPGTTFTFQVDDRLTRGSSNALRATCDARLF